MDGTVNQLLQPGMNAGFVALLLLAAFGAGALWRDRLRALWRGRNLPPAAQGVDQLPLSRDELALAIEAAGDGRWEWDLLEGMPRCYGPLYDRLGLGDTARGVDRKRWQALFHPDDLAPAQAALDDYLENRSSSYDVEFRLRDVQGHWNWIVSRGQAVERNAKGKVLRMIGMHYDHTARRRAERAAQGAMLLQMGCEAAQGYGIARPLPEDQLAQWMAQWMTKWNPDSSWRKASTY